MGYCLWRKAKTLITWVHSKLGDKARRDNWQNLPFQISETIWGGEPGEIY